MTLVTFEEVRLTRKKSVKCNVCGKRIQRQKGFWQTLNPWNKNANGMPKTRAEILAELKQDVSEWECQSETCGKCADAELKEVK